MMALIDILFMFITIIWIGEFIFFKNRRLDETESTETSSFPKIFLSVLAVIIVSIISREGQFLAVDLTAILWLGIFLYAIGVFIRYWGMMALGKQFTRNVNVNKEDKIIGSGPFRFLRHPLYSGLLSTMIGISFYTGSLLGLIITFTVFLPFLLKRIRLEEALLIKSFGQEYVRWSQSRRRLVPFIY
ncbi:methyltransferase family protein [Salipaludibacillus sp. HK11]|uniref:methyltransferase family protein n=1 Tax=Salipaludibacillus sp. HK11 TaxID=3394320 RepID=UPI0039FC42FB